MVPFCHQREGLPTKKSSLGSNVTLRTGASWPRSVFVWLLSDTSTTLTMKSLRNRERENKDVQTWLTASEQNRGKGSISCEPTWAQIVKSMNKRNKISLNVWQNPDVKSALTAWIFTINIITEMTGVKIAASIRHHALCFYCCDKPVQGKSILIANRCLSSDLKNRTNHKPIQSAALSVRWKSHSGVLLCAAHSVLEQQYST